MSSYSASAAARRGSVVPPLSGVDVTPQSDVPDKCDVLICGTGLVESILSAALAWQGSSVLHVDQNPYYGDSSACLNIDQLLKWVDSVNSVSSGTFSNAKLYIPRPLESRNYLIDLSPHLMFAKSDLLELLIKSRVFRYLEFKAIGNFHTFENDSFDKVASTKEDIFTDQSLSLATKRGLMKFMKFVLVWEEDPLWKDYETEPISTFMSEVFKLQHQQIAELVLAIGLCRSLEEPTPRALARIKRYMMSLDIYGNFPVLYSMYGSGGELSQGFSRSAAVAGATYKLSSKLAGFDEATKVASFADGSKVRVSEKIVVSPDHVVGTSPVSHKTISRMVAIVAKDCKEWFADNETASIAVFPAGTLSTNNGTVVQALVMGSGSGQCPDGQAIWYLSTVEQDTARAQKDLEAALERLEASILRESTEDFAFENVDESDVSYRADGMPVLSSVKLGQSLQKFVPKEKLQYLVKLSYSQKVSADLDIYPSDLPEGPSEDAVLCSPLPLSEISYDGVLSQVRDLYIKIVGSDDDFFDVDFEDDASVASAHNGTVADDIDKDDDFGHDMEL